MQASTVGPNLGEYVLQGEVGLQLESLIAMNVLYERKACLLVNRNIGSFDNLNPFSPVTFNGGFELFRSFYANTVASAL